MTLLTRTMRLALISIDSTAPEKETQSYSCCECDRGIVTAIGENSIKLTVLDYMHTAFINQSGEHDVKIEDNSDVPTPERLTESGALICDADMLENTFCRLCVQTKAPWATILAGLIKPGSSTLFTSKSALGDI